MATFRSAALLLLTVVPATGLTTGRQAGSSLDFSKANPVRKVVTMLQGMQKRVEAEGVKEKELYDKYMCYCKNSGEDLGKSIADAEAKIPAVGSDIAEAQAKKKQLGEDLKQHQADRAAAKEAMAAATAIREKEAAAFAKESTTLKSDISALEGAITAISNGMAGGFLQTRGARVLRHLVKIKTDMDEQDRDDIMAFLSGSSSTGYVPQSGQIVGILKEMKDEMSKDLADVTTAENRAVEAYEGLIAAKTREVNALTKSIETKMKKEGELAVAIVQMKNDLGDTEAALIEDRKFLADMDKNCDLKAKEWEERSKTRSEELAAISETIRILNDDEALELFKKTLPGAASFVQVRDNSNSLRAQALKILSALRAHGKDEPRLDFITLCMRGRKIGFEKVIKMIDDLVAELKQEQIDDDNKREYCNKQLDESDDTKKGLEQKIDDLNTAIAEAEDGISTTTSEIKTLKDNIKNLDEAVVEASKQRKDEHEQFTELMSSDSAAKEILNFAVNRLNKFYNPKLYKAPPKRELDLAQVRDAAAPPPPPETYGAYQKMDQENNGVVAMINLLVKDLDKEMAQAETEEEDNQKDYEQLMQDSKDKKAEMNKSLTEKQAANAAMQGDLESSKGDKASTSKELMATEQYIATLHSDCDWLIQYYDVRKTARADEVDALGKAKAVLSGADYSLL